MSKERYESIIKELELKKKEMVEIQAMKEKVRMLQREIDEMKPKGFFGRMFTKDEY